MHAPLRIEVTDEDGARGLKRSLGPLAAEPAQVDGHWEVVVELVETNPESRVVQVLNTIDGWLHSAGVPAVKVHLDGSSYTLHAPPAEVDGRGAMVPPRP